MKYSDVLIHINDEINVDEQDNFVAQLENLDGVNAPRFNKEKNHLILVSYDPNIISSLTLLNKIKEQGFEAQLVGL